MTGKRGLVDIGKGSWLKFHYTDPIFPFNFVRLFFACGIEGNWLSFDPATLALNQTWKTIITHMLNRINRNHLTMKDLYVHLWAQETAVTRPFLLKCSESKKFSRQSSNGYYRALLGLQETWLKHVSHSQKEIFDVAASLLIQHLTIQCSRCVSRSHMNNITTNTTPDMYTCMYLYSYITNIYTCYTTKRTIHVLCFPSSKKIMPRFNDMIQI